MGSSSERGDPAGASSPQRRAIRHVEGLAHRHAPGARHEIRTILGRTGLEESVLDDALGRIRRHARVVLHFHPDRLDRKGSTVAEALARDGIYRTQFETGLSSGSLTAFAGGERDSWEERLFGGAYHVPGVSVSERPRYGALDLTRNADGASPRFGSCYFVLAAGASGRSSFTWGGSQSPLALEHSGILEQMDCVLAPLLAAVERERSALGFEDLTVPRFCGLLAEMLDDPYSGPSTRIGRALDSFVEAQVHGPVELGRDAEWLVADPAFRGSAMEGVLEQICSTYGVALSWHAGFVLSVEEVPDDFRGPAMPPLARRIAPDGILDVAAIGRAAASLRREPEAWRDCGSHAETLQHLKQLWHVLVRFGAPKGA
jgi:hypothetical protein